MCVCVCVRVYVYIYMPSCAPETRRPGGPGVSATTEP